MTKTAQAQNLQRVMVFIDHSNVIHSIIKLRRSNPNQWVRWYDPLKLAKHLVGGRTFSGLYFFCTPPPAYLLTLTDIDRQKHNKQLGYYSAIYKLSDVNVKYGRTAGNKDDVHEKNLDTQLTSELQKCAYENKFDTAIVIANDGDYESGIATVKSLKKKIELAYFKGMCSMKTRMLCDVPRRLRPSYFERLIFTFQK